MKIATMEGHFDNQKGAPLVLFGYPDIANEKVHGKIAIPKLESLILTHDTEGFLPDLEAFPKEDWLNVPLVFWSFRIMVTIGFDMFVCSRFMVSMGAVQKKAIPIYLVASSGNISVHTRCLFASGFK